MNRQSNWNLKLSILRTQGRPRVAVRRKGTRPCTNSDLGNNRDACGIPLGQRRKPPHSQAAIGTTVLPRNSELRTPTSAITSTEETSATVLPRNSEP